MNHFPTVESRIKQYPACAAINLMESEKDLYTGAGWKLARFEDGTLVEFFDPIERPEKTALAEATAWLARHHGRSETWLVMCSCYQLCEPRRIAITDAAALAHMARVFGEQFARWERE